MRKHTPAEAIAAKARRQATARRYAIAHRSEHRLYMRRYRIVNANGERLRRLRHGRVSVSRAFADAAMAGGCVDCGTKEQVVLQFDHVRGKKVAEVSRLINGGATLPRLLEELDKCETRCANCHARITAQRRVSRAVA